MPAVACRVVVASSSGTTDGAGMRGVVFSNARMLRGCGCGGVGRTGLFEAVDTRGGGVVVLKRKANDEDARRELRLLLEAGDCDPLLVARAVSERLYEDFEVRGASTVDDGGLHGGPAAVELGLLAELGAHPRVLAIRHAGGTATLASAIRATRVNLGNLAPASPMRAPRRTDLSLARLARGAALCVAELHRASGLVHGDLRPSNLVLLEGGRCVMVDLGSGGPVGGESAPVSASYAAPERLDGARLTRAMDVWSLGAVVFGLANGCAPATRGAVRLGWRNTDARSAADLCALLMCDDPRERPSAADLMRHPLLRL
jgi:hypothetical protein